MITASAFAASGIVDEGPRMHDLRLASCAVVGVAIVSL
jgi:hypothetical protein